MPRNAMTKFAVMGLLTVTVACPNGCSRPAGPAAARKATPKVQPPAPSKSVEPSTPDSHVQVTALRTELGQPGQTYIKRLELRRGLMQWLRKADSLADLEAELTEQIADVEVTEGRDKAQRVALAEANTFQVQKDHRAAAAAFGVLLKRFPEGRFTAEGLYQRGICLLEQREYAQAADAWQQLVEQHDAAPYAPMAWRKLALAQALQAKFDESLATLEIMAAKYEGTDHGDYARMRRAYVQAAAGRAADARATYEKFLTDAPNSKYCMLVRRELAAIDRGIDVKADPKGR